MTDLGNLDANGVGRYDDPHHTVGLSFAQLLNLGLKSVSDALAPLRVLLAMQTVRRRAAANLGSSTSYQTFTPIGTAVVSNGDFSYTAGVFTCVRAGTYRVTLNISFAANATGIRSARLVHSGAAGPRTANPVAGAAGVDVSVGVQGVMAFAVGDTVTCQYYQSSGGNLSIAGDVTLERVA